jgi:bifunctional NMN adenylyltransferase/nudix hydrolase
MTVKIAVYIGRFQPFHLGHAHILRQACEENDIVIVAVGSSHQARTIKNPFDFSERHALISSWVRSSGTNTTVKIVPIIDYPYNDAKWIETVQLTVDAKIREYGHMPNKQITLYGSQRDSSTWYLSAFPQWKLKLVDKFPVSKNLNATSLRDHLFAGSYSAIWDDLPKATIDFLQGYIQGSKNYAQLRDEYTFIQKYKEQWKAAPYAPTFVTTDAVVVQSGHVLVVERANLPGKGLWALPGGFLNQEERLLDGAIRELIEETGIRLADGKKGLEITRDILRNSVKAEKVFDHPDRSLRGRTITTAFFFRLDDTKPLPTVKGQNMPLHESGGEEITETTWAKWLPFNAARLDTSKWFEDHWSILDTFLG